MEVINCLKNAAEHFLTNSKLTLNGIVILPKEVEVYYYKAGEFEDTSVHRNELQQNNKNHFYVHRFGLSTSDKYKGMNRAGMDFVVSEETGVFYSYLIRSAVINNTLVCGPNKVLKSVLEVSKLQLEELENSSVEVISNEERNIVLFSPRINIGANGKQFADFPLRAVLCDDWYVKSKYPHKEQMVVDYLVKNKINDSIAFAKEKLGYIPSQLRKVKMITDNLTNTVFLSDYLEKECRTLYTSLDTVLKDNGVDCRLLGNTNDFWCRDYMPIQVSEKRFVYYKYTPDYLLKDKKDAKYITDPKKVTNVPFPQDAEFVDLDLVIDGGNVVKCGNKIVMTEKVFTENKDKDESKVLRMLEDAFQCEVVMLPWDKEEKYGHSDGIIHYAGNNRVIMTNYADFDPRLDKEFRDILSEAGFEIISLNYNVEEHNEDSWAYVNFLQVGNLVLVPQLGLPEDAQALQQISNAMTGCKVVGIPAAEAVGQGGALNCVSWNVKL